MEEKIPWEKIQEYLTNKEVEFEEEFIAWINESRENRQIWEEAKIVYAINGSISKEFQPNEKTAWDSINSRISGTKYLINKYWLRIAASIILILLGSAISWMVTSQFNTPVYTEIYSPYGHKTMVVLPDSSKVWLNGNSHLKYETSFKKSRDVELKGEGLFEVTKDKSKLFSVKSGNMEVEVYGTTFNFKSYDEEENVEIALMEGSIGLFNKNKFLTNIEPGEVANYNKLSKSIQLSKQNIKQIISWSTDELIIKNESFDQVLKYLERWYGVEITKDKDFSIDHRLSFNIKTESLQEMLSVIDKVTPIRYEINGKKVRIFYQRKDMN